MLLDTQRAGTTAQDTTHGHGVNSNVLQNLAILGKPWESLHPTGQDCTSETASPTKKGWQQTSITAALHQIKTSLVTVKLLFRYQYLILYLSFFVKI